MIILLMKILLKCIKNIFQNNFYPLGNNLYLYNNKNKQMKILISFYEGSHQFNQEQFQGEIPEAAEIAKEQLMRQYKYRPTHESLWATFSTPDADGKMQEMHENRFVYKLGINKLSY